MKSVAALSQVEGFPGRSSTEGVLEIWCVTPTWPQWKRLFEAGTVDFSGHPIAFRTVLGINVNGVDYTEASPFERETHFLFYPPPLITSVRPTNGGCGGGYNVTLYGFNLLQLCEEKSKEDERKDEEIGLCEDNASASKLSGDLYVQPY